MLVRVPYDRCVDRVTALLALKTLAAVARH
jgi:hypothetical protein